MKLTEALERFLMAKPRSAASHRNYHQTMGMLFEDLGGGGRDVATVTREDLVAWFNQQNALDLSPWTIASRTRDAKALFRWLETEGYIPQSPAAVLKVKQYRPSHMKQLAISPANLSKMLEAGRRAGPREYAIVRFLADTGCRRSGLCSLRFDRMNLEEHIATLRRKGGSYYDVSLTRRVVAALHDYIAVRPDAETPYVFVIKQPPYYPLHPETLATIWRRLAESAGVTGRHNMHAVRHNFAARLAKTGVNMAYIQEALGHEDMETTRLYVRVCFDRLGELVEEVSVPD